MKLVRFQAEHLSKLRLQKGQEYFRSEFGNPDYGQQLESCKWAFTGLDDDGEVIICAGVQELWANRAVAWALISENATKHFTAIHRATEGFFAQAPWRRLEIMVEDGFPQAHRWAKMLKMQHEGCMRAYSPTGTDFHIYARIKNG